MHAFAKKDRFEIRKWDMFGQLKGAATPSEVGGNMQKALAGS
jgi:hypothetical protein